MEAMLEIIEKPIVINKETGQEISDNAEEVKFFGQINLKTFFVLIGKKFSLRCYTNLQHLAMGGPPMPKNPASIKHPLRLFVGPQDALREVAVHECEYYPFDPSKNTVVKSEYYTFNFPKKFIPTKLTPEENKGETEKSFATCNNQWIKVFDHPDMIKPPTKNKTAKSISSPQALREFKRRHDW